MREEEFEIKPKRDFKAILDGFLESRYFMAAVLILSCVIAFFLGRISGMEERREPLKIRREAASVQNAVTEPASEVVASKNGTKYHYPWCPGAKQIAADNLVTFSSIEEARAKGYTPASNCKGLK